MLANRWVFVDLFRFTAVILMIQGHVFDAYLDVAVKEMGWFEWHRFVHGFTAPMFLFSSGLAFGVATFRKWDDHTKPSYAVWKRVRRYLMLFLIGYWLHLPYPSLVRTITEASERQISIFLKVDALQIIAFTLIVCQLGVLLFRKKEVFITVLGFVLALIWSFTPMIWSGNYSGWPEAIVAYLNRSTSSYFPIFPWSMYLISGVITAYYFFKQSGFQNRRKIYLSVSIVALICIIIGQMGVSGLLSPFSNNNYIIFVVILRVGIILLYVLALFAFDLWLQKRRTGPNAHVPGLTLRTCIIMGQETLAVYVVHLLIVYGSVVNRRFLPEAADSLDLLGSSLYTLILFAAMGLYAWGWHTLKIERPGYFRTFQYSGATLILVMFVLNGWLI